MRRLRAQPVESQRHVELLEGAKRELDRLVGGAQGLTCPPLLGVSALKPKGQGSHLSWDFPFWFRWVLGSRSGFIALDSEPPSRGCMCVCGMVVQLSSSPQKSGARLEK